MAAQRDTYTMASTRSGAGCRGHLLLCGGPRWRACRSSLPRVWYGAESLRDDGQDWQSGITVVCGDGTVESVNQASYALYTYTPWIGVAGGGNELLWTLYGQYFGDPLAPELSSFTPRSAAAGGVVTLTGGGFTGATKASFNGSVASFVVDSDAEMTVTVPTGATNGAIAVTTAHGGASSTTHFIVLPTPTLRLAGLKGGITKLGRRVTAKGAVTPCSLVGSKVTLIVQRTRNGRRLKVANATCTIGANHAYRATYKLAKRGSYRLKATIAKSDRTAAATTKWLAFTMTD